MKTLLVAYVATGIVFLVIDGIWLSLMADHLYRPLLGDRLAPQFHLAPAALFYLIYIGGMVYFAILPALMAGRLSTAALNGAVLGLVAYATYDLTNQATLRDWPLQITLADIAWGTVLTCVASAGGYLAASRFGD